MTRVPALAACVLLFVGSLAAASAQQLPGVRVYVPQGIRAGFTTVEPGPKPGTKYVVIQNVIIANANPYSTAAWKKHDFSLVVGEKRYHPVVRPTMAAIDIALGGVLGPHEALKGDLPFVVPDDVTSAKLEFFPAQWYDTNGVPAKFCCLPYP